MAGWVRIRTAVPQNVVRQALQFGLEVTLFVMEKAFAVCDEILKVPDLWPVHRRIINFGDDAAPKGKPDPAGSCISSSHAVVSSVRPSRLDARRKRRRGSFPDSMQIGRAHV